jgi:alkyldihydroxyacetonephosphate synthase
MDDTPIAPIKEPFMSRLEAVRQALIDLLGPTQVIADAPHLALYRLDGLRPSRGYRDRERLGVMPGCVVRPRRTADVQALVQWAKAAHKALVPYGGGTGLMGGAMADQESVLIDFKDMADIVAIRPEDQHAVVQSGVVLSRLEDALRAQGLTLGHDPWTVGIATVGGTISTDSLGYRGGQYGSMGEQVLGLEVVLPDAQVLRTRAVPKSSTGPDLTQLFIGAEGVFGLITEATLQVFPAPEAHALLAFTFPTFAQGFAAVVEMASVGLRPALLKTSEKWWHARFGIVAIALPSVFRRIASRIFHTASLTPVPKRASTISTLPFPPRKSCVIARQRWSCASTKGFW